MSKSLKGITYISLSAVFFGTYGIWSKLMGSSFGDFSQAWTRGLIITIILVVFGMYKNSYKKIALKDLKWFSVLLLGAFNQAPYYYAFRHLTIGTATLLFYSSLTVAGYLYGKFVFKEAIGPIKLISLALAIVGMVILFGFSLSPADILAGLAGVTAGALGGIVVSNTKKISGTYSLIQILTVIFGAMVIANLLIAGLLNDPLPTLSYSSAWIAQFAYAFSMLAALCFVVKGFIYAEASIGSIVGLTEILFAVLFGVILFNEVITASLIVGGGCILAAAILPNLKEYSNRSDST